MNSIEKHPDLSLETLQGMMITVGVTKLLVKELAPNDNSKNQPYVAKNNLDAINILPAGEFRVDPISRKLKAPLDFYWLQHNGELSRAPQTKLIFYPEYPELRLSGFLQGAAAAPNYLMNTRLKGRLLFLGIDKNRRIVAWVAGPESSLARAYAALGRLERLGVFAVVPLVPNEYGFSTRDLLINELRRIRGLDWIDSKSLKSDGSIVECKASHCVGYTLEAELGIARNAFSEPDFKGWEVKATTVKRLSARPSSKAITLMTPEPTGGHYRTDGVEAFVRKFGYPDKKGRPDRLNFGGIFRSGVYHTGTKLTMKLDGFDTENEELVDPSGSLKLVAPSGEIAAEWSFASLMTLWNRKHAQTVYVPAESKKVPRQYRYGGSVRFAEGTNFIRLLEAISAGQVYYDPGIKLEAESSSAPRKKNRSQFRIKSHALPMLYSKMESIEILVP